LTLLAGWQEGHQACKKTEWWGAGVVICLEQGADLRMAQLMPLPLTVSCSSKIQIGFTFLVPAHPGSPGQRAIERVCVTIMNLTYSYDFLQILCTFAAVPNKARVVDIFCNRRFMTILQATKQLMITS